MRRVSRSRVLWVTFVCVALIVVFRFTGIPGHTLMPSVVAATPCDAPANAIVAENCLPGATDLNLSTPNDVSIQGFASPISVNQGDTVNFKIKTDSPLYHIDIYRLGYYGGAGARKITQSDITPARLQPDCLTDATTGLYDCGTWDVSATWSTAGQTSGIYLAKLTRTDGLAQGASHMVFIVRNDASHSDLLFQTSDETWQAYNRYGGASLYCGGPIPNTGSEYCPGGRAAKVSYNRPFDTRDHDPQSWLFNAEYPMLRWLEANGYDLSYFTGVDADSSPALIKNHKIYLSVGHDEYWSANQRANVEAARDAGVHLAFFSGNEVFWKTRWENSIDGSNTARRTLVTYKETIPGAKIDPSPAWTGTWRDPRFSPPADGGRPENGLTGTIWTVNCCSYPISVPAAMGANRFWRNTSVAALAPGTVATLATDTLGYEWDEDLDNGFRPAGLTRLSSTTVSVPEKLIDYGANVAAGIATHSLTLYRKSTVDALGNVKTALVFGAGTVQWAWGLDGVHDRGVSIPDPRMQQATVNLFADMLVQPQTLQTGLVPATASSDTTAPTSTVTSPAAGATVSSGVRIAIMGTASDVGGTVAGVEVSVDGGATWHAARGAASWTYDWLPGAAGIATIQSRATDDSGNIGAPSTPFTVTIAGSNCPCPSLWDHDTATPQTVDSGDTSGIEVGVRFSSDVAGFITGVRFYKASTNTGTHVAHLWTASGTLLATATFTAESAAGWQLVSFSAPVAILANTPYVASYHTNVGHYAADPLYFASAGINSPPLHAPASTGTAPNGVFVYGTSAFPTSTFNATNYWVDVDFAQSVADTTGPAISQITATAIDGSTAVIAWKTSEAADSRVDYSTTATLPAAQTQSATDGAFVTQHSLTLTGLTPNATYFFRITSLDAAGNAAVSLAPSFTMPGQTLHDTGSVDFLAGTRGTTCDASGQNCVINTYVAETGNGEVILAPTAGTEFSGTALDPGWIAVPWQTQGTATLGGGVLLVDGARVGTCDVTPSGDCEAGIYGPGHSLEFIATFTGDAFQHSGFGVKMEAPPWAVFSTGSGGTLLARTASAIGATDTPLGTTLLGAPHRFRIDWTTGFVTYSVDGVQVATHAIANGIVMRPIAASDFNAFGGNVAVDWMRLMPYATSGAFISRIFDAHAPVDWNTVTWSNVLPAGTTLTISVRTGNTPVPDASWSSFAVVSAPGAFTGHSQYVQYRADLASGDAFQTPQLTDIVISNDHAPVANDDAATTPQNTPYTFGANGTTSLTANDTDVDTPAAQLRVVSVSPPLHGTATVIAGAVTYTPVSGFLGTDSFTYVVTDGLLTATGHVSMSIGNTPPVANDEGSSAAPAYVVNEDTTLNVAGAARVTANDTDPNGGVLTAVLATQAAHGTVVLNGDGSFVYMPAPDTFGVDSFTYFDRDPFGAVSNIARVFIGVNAVNDPPVFVNGPSQIVAEDAGPQTVVGWATGISAGPNESGQTLNFIVGNNNPALFSVQPAIAANGTLTYTSAPNANGSAIVTVQLHDNGGIANGGVDTSAPQTFTISVTPVNDAPVANAQSVTTAEDTPQPIVLVASDIDSITLSYSVVSGPAHGTLSGTAPNVTYTPAANYNGPDSFTFKANDGALDSNIATVSITVTPVNDAPVANAQSVTTQQEIAKAITLTATDVDGDKLTYSIVANPAHGTLTGTAPNVTYTPALGYVGADSFTFKANDATLASNIATVAINVTPKPTLSVANPSVIEGNGGCVTTPMPFTVSLSAVSAGTVTVSYQTVNLTAIGEATCTIKSKGYLTASGTLTFAPGETSKTVTVQIVGDTIKEANKTFALRLSSAVNATLPAADGIGTILDDDARPKIKAVSSSVIEGNTGQKTMLFTVAPTNGDELQMSVDYTTLPGVSARVNIDYLTTAGTLIFPPYSIDPQVIAVPVIGNLRHQPTHQVLLRLQNAIEALLDGIDTPGDIVDDDPIPAMSIADIFVSEAASGAVNAVLTVTLSNDTDDVVNVNYSTADGSAIAGLDYPATTGTLSFQPGITSQVITIPVYAAIAGEPTETFFVDLTGAVNATIAKSRAMVTIVSPTSWVTTTTAEFGRGTLGTGAYLSETTGGEITLAPTAGAEFSGTALPTGWTKALSLTSTGVATVANGVLFVDGTTVTSSATFGVGHTLEFVATFSGQPNQGAGFGLTSALIPPLAAFGVKADGLFYARSIAPGQLIETPIAGAFFGAPHRFRIDWNATTVVYWIDGIQRVTHTISYPARTGTMRPAITDQTVGGGGVSVDWMRMTPNAASGVYTSAVFDAAAPVSWANASWVADVPAGTSVLVEVRTGTTAIPDTTNWTAFQAIASGGAMTGTSRYAQYRVTVSTTVPNAAPAVKEVAVNFAR